MGMESNENANSVPSRRDLVVAVCLFILLVSVSLLLAFGLGRLFSVLFGVQAVLNIPYYARLAGLVPIAVGVFFDTWVYTYRKLRNIVSSTLLTALKFFDRSKMAQMLGRSELFLPGGPYRFVRNPLYFGDLAIIYGLSLVLGSTFLFLWGIILTLWLWFVGIPFEERELLLLFGERYMQYQQQVPKLLPYGRRYKPPKPETVEATDPL